MSPPVMELWATFGVIRYLDAFAALDYRMGVCGTDSGRVTTCDIGYCKAFTVNNVVLHHFSCINLFLYCS